MKINVYPCKYNYIDVCRYIHIDESIYIYLYIYIYICIWMCFL
jgi:hypothetical protein